MSRLIVAILVLLSSAASVYYAFGGVIKPETILVYNKANMSRSGIQLLSLFLGIGGLLLLFPVTFKIGGTMLMIHSLATFFCFIIIKDWRAGLFEFLMLPIPVFILRAGYPVAVLEKLRTLLS